MRDPDISGPTGQCHVDNYLSSLAFGCASLLTKPSVPPANATFPSARVSYSARLRVAGSGAAEAMAPRDPKDGGGAGGGGGGAADPEGDIEAPLLASSGSSFFLDPAAEDGDDEQRRRRRRFLLGSHTQSNTTSQVALVGADVCPIQSLDYE